MAGSSLWKFAVEESGGRSQETEWQPGGARLLRVHRSVAGLRANFRGGFQAGLTPLANSEIEVGDSETGGDWRGTKSSSPESSGHGWTPFVARRQVKLDPNQDDFPQVAGRIRSNPSRILRVNWRWDRADEAKHHTGNRPAPFEARALLRGTARHR